MRSSRIKYHNSFTGTDVEHRSPRELQRSWTVPEEIPSSNEEVLTPDSQRKHNSLSRVSSTPVSNMLTENDENAFYQNISGQSSPPSLCAYKNTIFKDKMSTSKRMRKNAGFSLFNNKFKIF